MGGARYVTISALFILSFVIFMAFNPGLYNANINEEQTVAIRSAFGPSETPSESPPPTPMEGAGYLRFAVVTGGADTPAVEHVRFTLACLKYPTAVYETVADFVAADGAFSTLILTRPDLAGEELSAVQDFLTAGGDVVFTTLPASVYAPESELAAMLGILTAAEGAVVEGFDINEKILLGGRFRAENWRFSCAKVTLSGLCKVYANGFDPARDKTAQVIDRRYLNPILWRTYYGAGGIYVFNAPFMEGEAGIGILTGLLAQAAGDFIYPVVGAETVVLDGFPYIAPEEQLLNYRTVYAFSRDVVWPTLIAIAQENDIVFTCLANGNFAQNETAEQTVEYFTGEIYKAMRGEMGYRVPTDPAQFEDDAARLRAWGFYTFRSFQSSEAGADAGLIAANAEHLSALLLPGGTRGSLAWVSERAVTVPVLSRGFGSEEESLKFVGGVSALGLAVHSVDMRVPIEAADSESEWNRYAVEVAKYFSYLFAHTGHLRSLTLSQTAEAVKQYIEASFTVHRTAEGLLLSLPEGGGAVQFMLRTDKEIARAAGCRYEEIERGVYLITAEATAVQLVLTVPAFSWGVGS